MKEFHLSTHNGQWLYKFVGNFETGDNGSGLILELKKYECIYCGSGDYVLSAKPSPISTVDFGERATQIVDGGLPETPREIPEPVSFWGVFLAIAVILIWRRFHERTLRTLRETNSRTF